MEEYGYWQESAWQSAIDWRLASKITAGLDIGTTSSQAVILCDKKVFSYANIHTGPSFSEAAAKVMRCALGDCGMSVSDIQRTVSTGWGKAHVAHADFQCDEVHCHAFGARYMYGPDVRTVVDLGGQTVKAIHLYDWNRVWDFMMNDKCATGMGSAIEEICDLLHVPIERIGPLSLEVPRDPEPVSTTCYNFANIETMGLFRPGYREDPLTTNQIYASHLFAVAWRILGVIGRIQPQDVGDIKVFERVAFTGGMAKNVGITKRLERELKTTALVSDYDPMLAGAIGAAVLADEQLEG